MTVRVGVIGVGTIGEDHIRRLSQVVAGAEVVAVADVDPDRARAAAAKYGVATVHPTGQELISDPAVDAVAVCSWGPTHEEYVLASIAAGKPVFCEKPLAETPEACERMIEAEVSAGRRLVQVGFMRRYDRAYRALKEVVDAGSIGAPLIVHCVHRNPTVPGYFQSESLITDAAVHEFDILRWLLAEEITTTSVLVPKRNRHGGDLQDPVMLILEMDSGAIVDVEISMNIRYGYDIQGTVVGEDGTAALGDQDAVVVRLAGGTTSPVAADWRERFIRAYDVEFQEWIDAIAGSGVPTGPTTWDGYAAAVVANTALEALRTGARTSVKLVEKPAFYDQ